MKKQDKQDIRAKHEDIARHAVDIVICPRCGQPIGTSRQGQPIEIALDIINALCRKIDSSTGKWTHIAAKGEEYFGAMKLRGFSESESEELLKLLYNSGQIYETMPGYWLPLSWNV